MDFSFVLSLKNQSNSEVVKWFEACSDGLLVSCRAQPCAEELPDFPLVDAKPVEWGSGSGNLRRTYPRDVWTGGLRRFYNRQTDPVNCSSGEL